MSADHPVCERCKQPILPGQHVTPIGKTDEELFEERIFVSGDLIFVHAYPRDCEEAE